MKGTALVGSGGKIGSVLASQCQALIEEGQELDYGGADTVIHSAIDWTRRGRPHLENVLDALEAAEVQGIRRFIFMSSVWADPQAYGLFNETGGEYRAAKLAAEAFLRAWQEAVPGRAAVALRIGRFIPTCRNFRMRSRGG